MKNHILKLMSKLIIAILMFSISVPFKVYSESYSQEKSETLTFEEAFYTALLNSNKLKNIDEERYKYEEQSKKLTNNAYLGAKNLLKNTALSSSIVEGSATLDVAQRAKKMEYEATKEGLEMQIRAAFYKINRQNENIKLKEDEIKNLESKNKITNLKYEVGNESKYTSKVSKIEIDKAKEELQREKEKLSKEYINLSSLMGINYLENRKLEDLVIEFSPIDEVEQNVEYTIAKAENESAGLWYKERQAELAKLKEVLYLPEIQAGNDNVTPLVVRETDTRIKNNEIVDYKIGIENAVRGTYNSLKELESGIRTMEVQMETLNEGIKAKEAQFKVGMATKQELQDLYISKEKLENMIYNYKIDHCMLKMQYDKPYLIIPTTK